MKIGELSERTGLSIDTIRYYEKLGLIAAPWRNAGARGSMIPIFWVGSTS